MPKFKVKRSSTWVDMTAMCDVSFLLLSFFILTAKFKPTEVVPIKSPTSRASEEVKEDMVTFTVDADGKTYMSIGKPERKVQILEKFFSLNKDKYPGIPITDQTKKLFTKLEIFGTPVNQLPSVVTKSSTDLIQLQRSGELKGIPTDSTDNQLGDWIMAIRYVYAEQENNDQPPIAIKGDQETNIKGVKRVIEILKEKDVNKYKLITTLEGKVD